MGNLTEATLCVEEALALFMAQEQSWACRTVARANPAKAFEAYASEVPALWLSEKHRFPKYYKDLLAALPSEEMRRQAIENCARLMAHKSLESIVPALCFQSAWPQASAARRLRCEAKLVTSIAKLIAAASGGAMGMASFRSAAKDGIGLGIDDFKRGFPARAAIANDLRWEFLADDALARSERKAMEKIAPKAFGEEGEGVVAPAKSMRL